MNLWVSTKKAARLTWLATSVFLLWCVFSLFYQKGAFLLTSNMPCADRAILLGAVVVQIVIGMRVALWSVSFFDRKRVQGWRIRRQELVKEFNDGFNASLWPQEQIANALLEQGAEQRRLDPAEAVEAEQTRLALEDLVQTTRRITTAKRERSWYSVSKTLSKIRMFCDKGCKPDLAKKVAEQHSQVKKVQRVDVAIKSLPILSFLAAFLVGFFLSGLLCGTVLLLLRGETPLLFLNWSKPVGLVIGALLSLLLIPKVMNWGIRSLTERTWSDWDDVIVGIIIYPVSIGLTLSALVFAIGQVPPYFTSLVQSLWSSITASLIQQITFIVFLGWITIHVFNSVVIFSLKKYAARTETKYDDVFVRILQVFGTFILGVIALGIILVKSEPALRLVPGEGNVLLPYSIVVSAIGAVLGFSFREAIENFFSGILLQIDKPFEKGDRLVLETGEICDVLNLGMRSTILHNVIQSTEVSIPNRVLANQKITNISRPDRQLRIQVPIVIQNGKDTLARAEEILLDIAYVDGEIDEARFCNAELPKVLKDKGRVGLMERVTSLENTFPEIRDTRIFRIIGGESREEAVFEPESGDSKRERRIYECLRQLRELRVKHEMSAAEETRLRLVRDIAVRLGWLTDALLAISESHGEARRDMDDIFAELRREPTVYSQYSISEEGVTYISIDFNIYALHLVRRFEVAHKVNKAIQERFADKGIMVK